MGGCPACHPYPFLMANQETNVEQETTDKNEGPGLFGFAAILTALCIGCLTMWYNGTKMVQWWHAEQLVPGQAVVWDIFKEGGGYVSDLDLPKNRTAARLYGIFDLEIEGKTYRSREVDLWNRSKDLREGDVVTVFYTPDNPSEMHLTKDLPIVGPILVFLLGVLFGVAGAYGVIGSVQIWMRSDDSQT